VIDVDTKDNVPVVRIKGDIDMANTPFIEDEIGRRVKSEEIGYVLDLAQVTYLDSAGIRLMYHLDERARDRQQQVVIVIPQGAQINRTLEAAGVIGSLRICATEDEALVAVRAPE
jgi:anti-anti-sigma factor